MSFNNTVGKEYLQDKLSPEIMKRVEDASYIGGLNTTPAPGTTFGLTSGKVMIKKCIPASLTIYNGQVHGSLATTDPTTNYRLYHELKSHDIGLRSSLSNGTQPRYEENLLKIPMDNLRELEVTGLCKHSRNYTVEFNLKNQIDLLMSEVFMLPRIEVREFLEKNYPDYHIFSQGILSQSEYLLGLEGFSLAKLEGLSENITKLFEELTVNKSTMYKTSYGETIDLRNYRL